LNKSSILFLGRFRMPANDPKLLKLLEPSLDRGPRAFPQFDKIVVRQAKTRGLSDEEYLHDTFSVDPDSFWQGREKRLIMRPRSSHVRFFFHSAPSVGSQERLASGRRIANLTVTDRCGILLLLQEVHIAAGETAISSAVSYSFLE